MSTDFGPRVELDCTIDEMKIVDIRRNEAECQCVTGYISSRYAGAERPWIHASGGIGRNGVPKNVAQVSEKVMGKREMPEQGDAQQQQNHKGWCG